MNKYLSIITVALGLAAWASGAISLEAAPLPGGLVARVHFAGGDTVAANPEYGSVKNIWSSPQALAMRADALDKLDRFLGVWLRQQIAPNMGAAVQTRPLLADLLTSEWQLDLYQPSGDAVEFSLAVRLDAARAQAWVATFTPVVAGWKQTSPAHHGQLERSGNWLFLQLGNSPVPAPAASISPLNGDWLTADVDWGRLAAWFPAVRKFDVPQTHLEVAGHEGNFEIKGNLTLAQPLPLLEKWQFPTNTIHAGFISFTAVRGISDWLKQQPWVASLGIDPLPNQLFAWVEPQVPYQTFAIMPMPAAPAALPALDRVLKKKLAEAGTNASYANFSIDSTNNQLTLIGMPLIAPYIQAVHEPSGEFLEAGFFPNFPRGQPVPAQLFSRLEEPGLVYYHWEVTSERMKLFPQLYQLLFVVSHHYQVDASAAAGKWLIQVVTNLGPTVTTATEVSPTELSFSRKAPAGLTALELVALASWLGGPDFPGCDLRLPPSRFHRHHPPAATRPGPVILNH